MSDLTNILPGGFDAQAVEPQENRSAEPVPAGVYDVEITSAEVKDAKSGNGVGLKLEYTIVGPTHARRKIFGYLNLRHTNQQAEQIGQSQLSSLCRAVGINKLTDSDQLFQRMLRISVKVRPAEGTYAASNDVIGYEARYVSDQSAPSKHSAPAPAASAAKTPPWKRAG